MRDAFALLTIIPTGRNREPGRAAVLAFPFVGAAVGSLLWLVSLGAMRLWSPFVAAALVLVADLIITGAMHIDAVADVGDAIGSRKSGAEGLAVARDSRVGAIGVAAAGAVMVLFVALVADLLSQGAALGVVVMAIASRTSMAAVLVLASGQGSSSGRLAMRSGAAAIRASVLVGLAMAAMIGGLRGGVGAAAGVAVALLAAFFLKVRFGEVTGDATGSAGVLAGLACLLILAAA